MKLKTLLCSAAALVGLTVPLAASAGFDKTNPVTGETETYTWKFVGTDTWDDTQYWQDSSEEAPTGVPAKTGENTWDPILFEGNTININASMSVEGWNLRMGLYDGASVTLNTFVKWQGNTTMWVTVDETSKFTVGGFGKGNLSDGQVIKCSTTRENGIEWLVNLESTGTANNTFEYYLAGAGSVSYQAVSNANHKIKMADVTLSGTSQVASKALVSFTSSSKTFTADATIKIKNGNGDVLRTVPLASVTSGETTSLTTDDYVGTCELVQTSTGIVLYYVDGDPEALPVYKPSININFTDGANGLTTRAAVGLDGYAVPGTSWNNFVVANNTTYSTVNAIDSTGAASVASGVSVTVSGTRGSYSCGNLTPSSNPLHGYIDENASYPTPTVTITGIPYEHYRVIVYHSTDQANAKFGYDTINGFNFTYDQNKVQQTGTDAWGNAGAGDSAEPIAEGVNTLVSAVLSGDTVTMVAHRMSSARGCFAAIQVVEYVPEVGENDLEIAVDGATNYAVDTAKTLSGTVYLTGSGTLTLSGSEKITAATIDVGRDVVLNINADRLDATTFTGAGTVVYDGAAPVAEKGWTAIGWSGTVWLKNQAISSFEGNQYGNDSSTIRFTGVTGFLQTNTYNNKGYVHTVPLELVDDGDTVAFTYNNGWSGYLVKINTLKGTGTLKTKDSGLGEHIYIVDGSGFAGVFNLTGKYVYVGGSQPESTPATNPEGKLEIRSGVTLTVPSGKTWTANGGFVVNGTLNVDGTLASSHTTKAVSGSGTVVFGGVPSPTDDAWWKNADWTGTVQVNGYTSMAGNIPFNSCGNAGSIVELKNVTGWINNNFTCTPKLKITGTLYLNDGSSNKSNAFKVGTLLGDGVISGYGSAPTVVFNVTTDWSGFTGTVELNNKCVVFGETIPDELTAGTIYVSAGAVVTPQQASGTWWAVGGIKVDGELRAPNLDKFGGGTTITTSDTGVFTLTDSNNTQDQAVDYARITGTGTLRYADVSGKWRTLSRVNFPTGMICENNLSEGLILQAVGEEHVIGSLAGSGVMRSDWTSGNRSLKILQAKDTVYSGVFHSDDRISTVTVAPGASTAGTLTLSGEQTASNDLVVDAGAAVNLTGTWVGATTVAGTFGGTGTLTGDLTFSEGATFKAFSIGNTGLTVSGDVVCEIDDTDPEAEAEPILVDVSAIQPEVDVVLLSCANGIDADMFALDENAPEGYTLEVDENALTLVLPLVDFTVPALDGAAAIVTVGGDVITPKTEGGNVYAIKPGSTAVVTYTATGEGKIVSGKSVYEVDVTVSNNTFELEETTEVADVVAKVVDTSTAPAAETSYATFQEAVTAAAGNSFAYVEVLADGVATANGAQILIKPGEFAITISCETAGYGDYTRGTELVTGIFAYDTAPDAATFVWNPEVESGDWSNVDNWTSMDGIVNAAPNNALYTAEFESAADVTLAKDIALACINVGAAVSISTSVPTTTYTITAGEVILTSVDATLTLTKVSLSSEPTVSDDLAGDYEVATDDTVTDVVTYTVVEKPSSTPVVPGTEPTGSYDTAEEAVAAVSVGVSEGVAADLTLAGVTEDVYKALFQVVAVENGDGTYAAQVVLKDEVQTDVEDAVADAEESIVDDFINGDAASVTVVTTPGLYYSIEVGSTVGTMVEGERTMASGDSMTFSPVKPDGSGFYRVRVNATPKAE